jgi:hypothetical protein
MLYRDILNIVEDRRVNTLLYSKYPGYSAERARVDAIDLAALPELSDFPEEARFIQAFLERLLLGGVKGSLQPEDAPAVAALLRLVEAQNPFATDVFDSSMVAGEALLVIVGHLGQRHPKALAKLRAAMNKLDITLGTLGARFGERNGHLEFELEELRFADREGEAPGRRQRAIRAAAFGEALRDFGQIRIPDPLAGRRLFVYPEWVDWKLAYDREACLLAEFPVDFQAEALPSPGAAVGAGAEGADRVARRDLVSRLDRARGRAGDRLRAREQHAAEAVRRAFASIKENLDVLERGAEDGDDIDFDRAVDCFMDFAAGDRVDMDFYLRRSRKARDLLCALVLDMSPSTAALVDGRAIFEHEVSAAYLMSEALASIGDSFGIFSYFDFGPRANIFHVIKDFDAPYDREAVDSLASLRCAESGFSRIAPGLRHILAKMRDREARAKIVFLVTDGQPVYLDSIRDEGRTSKSYWVDGHEVSSPVPVRVRRLTTASDEYAYADLRKTAEEARLAGVLLVCVTLDAESLLPLSSVFGESLVYLDRASALPGRLVEIFRRMTR